MANGENKNGNGSLIVCLIIIRMFVSIHDRGIRRILDAQPRGIPDMSGEQSAYMQQVRQRTLSQLRNTSQLKYSPSEANTRE
jgi:hypothetical protein